MMKNIYVNSSTHQFFGGSFLTSKFRNRTTTIKGGADLNDNRRFGQTFGIFLGGCHEHWRDTSPQ